MNREFLCISFFEGVASERFPNQNCHTKVAAAAAAAGERDKKKLEKERKERKLYNNKKRKEKKREGLFLFVIPFATLCTH
jgi:ribosomal protein L12E/L44/L45/RPP1/RPP2